MIAENYMVKLYGQQKIGGLPEESLIEEPPFSYSGVDMFGPFLVKESQKNTNSITTIHMVVQLCCLHTDNKQYDH